SRGPRQRGRQRRPRPAHDVAHRRTGRARVPGGPRPRQGGVGAGQALEGVAGAGPAAPATRAALGGGEGGGPARPYVSAARPRRRTKGSTGRAPRSPAARTQGRPTFTGRPHAPCAGAVLATPIGPATPRSACGLVGSDP